MARSSKYGRWLEPDGLVLLSGWARDGLTDEQIARNMEIATRTLYRWKDSHEAICQALKKGKEVVDYAVENALLKSALEGNVTAQIIWLKNRRPKKWRDRPVADGEEALSAIRELVETNKEVARSVQDSVQRKASKGDN